MLGTLTPPIPRPRRVGSTSTLPGFRNSRSHPRALRRPLRLRDRQQRQRLERVALLRDLGRDTSRQFFGGDTKKRLKISASPTTLGITRVGQRRRFRSRFPGTIEESRPAICSSRSADREQPIVGLSGGNKRGLTTFGCTGFSGGKLRGLAHRGLHVPLDDMGIVESIHLTAFHWVVDDLHRRISLS